MGVPKDSAEKVMQIHRSCYVHTQVRDNGKDELDHRNNRLEKGRNLSIRLPDEIHVVITTERIDNPTGKG